MKRLFLFLYVPLTLLYLLIVVVYPVDQSTIALRNLSLQQARLAAFVVAIPSIAVWYAALFGASKLYVFSRSIRQSKDGPPFMKLAKGIFILALFIPIRLVVRAYLNYAAYRHPAFEVTASVLMTYMNLAVPLAAFIIISQAAHDLARLAQSSIRLLEVHILGVVFACLAASYCYVTFEASDSIGQTNWLITPQSVFPPVQRIFTVLIPQLYMWIIGLVSMYELYLFRSQISGKLYRQFVSKVTYGLMAILIVSICIQFFTAAAGYMQKLPFIIILVIALCLLMFLGSAFLYMSHGVDRLRQLDEA